MLNPQSWDNRRDLIVPGDRLATIAFAVKDLMAAAERAIADHGAFYIALSGGSTPKAIYEELCQPQQKIEWGKWHLFWSDERSVPSNHPESNYHMAMEAGFKKMMIPPDQIHRMQAEKEIEKEAHLYEKTIQDRLQGRGFDFMMLGMGEDGHTASLFPFTDGLKAQGKLVIANYIPQLQTWRMTLTFDCINASSHIVCYVLGSQKREKLRQVLEPTASFEELPSYKIGTPTYKALWVVDESAGLSLRNAS